MSATIREKAVFTDAWNTIFAKLNIIFISGAPTKFLYSAFPEKEIADSNSYPLIVLEPVQLSYDPVTMKNLKAGPMRITVDVYSTTAQQLDSVSDSVLDTMEANENNSSFLASGVHGMKLISSAYSQFSRNTLRVHNKEFVYEFEYRFY